MIKRYSSYPKYNINPTCIDFVCYYLKNVNLKSVPKVEMPIFMEWAINSTEEVTMGKFYWYMNAKYIQRSSINDKFEKALEAFDNDPVTALIKLTKS